MGRTLGVPEGTHRVPTYPSPLTPLPTGLMGQPIRAWGVRPRRFSSQEWVLIGTFSQRTDQPTKTRSSSRRAPYFQQRPSARVLFP